MVRDGRQIGRVLQALDAGGLARNTIVIFTSDNGGERFSDTWPFTGKKTELLEGGLRIPAMVCWPGAHPGRAHQRAGDDQHGLAPDPAGRRRRAPDPAYPSDGMSLLPMLAEGGAVHARKLFWRYKAQCAAGRARSAT